MRMCAQEAVTQCRKLAAGPYSLWLKDEAERENNTALAFDPRLTCVFFFFKRKKKKQALTLLNERLKTELVIKLQND